MKRKKKKLVLDRDRLRSLALNPGVVAGGATYTECSNRCDDSAGGHTCLMLCKGDSADCGSYLAYTCRCDE